MQTTPLALCGRTLGLMQATFLGVRADTTAPLHRAHPHQPPHALTPCLAPCLSFCPPSFLCFMLVLWVFLPPAPPPPPPSPLTRSSCASLCTCSAPLPGSHLLSKFPICIYIYIYFGVLMLSRRGRVPPRTTTPTTTPCSSTPSRATPTSSTAWHGATLATPWSRHARWGEGGSGAWGVKGLGAHRGTRRCLYVW